MYTPWPSIIALYHISTRLFARAILETTTTKKTSPKPKWRNRESMTLEHTAHHNPSRKQQNEQRRMHIGRTAPRTSPLKCIPKHSPTNVTHTIHKKTKHKQPRHKKKKKNQSVQVRTLFPHTPLPPSPHVRLVHSSKVALFEHASVHPAVPSDGGTHPQRCPSPTSFAGGFEAGKGKDGGRGSSCFAYRSC